MQIRKYVYCQNTTGENALAVQIGELTVYFSYETVVAFRSPKTGLVVSENVWSTTTGKHLNAIGPKDMRIDNEEFQILLNETLKTHGLEV